MKIEHTPRGFELICFQDRNGEKCSLQQSSIADYEQPGSTAVWLGCERNAQKIDGIEISPRMHLDREQVRELIEHLQSWLNAGTFETGWRKIELPK